MFRNQHVYKTPNPVQFLMAAAHTLSRFVVGAHATPLLDVMALKDKCFVNGRRKASMLMGLEARRLAAKEAPQNSTRRPRNY